MSYSVYVIYSKTLNRFYKGHSDDLEERLKYHNSRYEDFTSKGIPWLLLWIDRKTSRSEALDLESKLKNLTRIRLIQFMLKYSSGIVNEKAFRLIHDLYDSEGSSQ